MATKIASIAVLSTALLTGNAAAAEFDRESVRFGIGFGLLASEQCPDIATGPMFDTMIWILEVGAKRGGKVFDKPAFFAETKQEAAQQLAGKDICEEARKVAQPKGIVILK